MPDFIPIVRPAFKSTAFVLSAMSVRVGKKARKLHCAWRSARKIGVQRTFGLRRLCATPVDLDRLCWLVPIDSALQLNSWETGVAAVSARTIHPFPARMAPEIALDAIPERESAEQLLVIDPMCGSGTVLSAAVQRGQRALGIDIDPLAVMMSTVATSAADFTSLSQLARSTVKSTRELRADVPWIDDETERFADYWFGKEQKRQLTVLTSAIANVENVDHKLALQVALSRIIVTKSPQASLAADTSHSRPHRVLLESEYDVFSGFEKSAKALERLLGRREQSGSAKVLLGDSRTLGGIKDGSADLAVTSPPYLNALDYLRGHKLALIWFGHSIPSLREIRRDSIGAERALDGPPEPLATELANMVTDSAADPDVLPKGTILRFANDMVSFAKQLRRVLRSDGSVVVVVGNSTLKGNYIRNDLITQTALEAVGFNLSSRHEREIPPQNRYMAVRSNSSDLAMAKRMRSEIVLKMEGNDRV